MATDLYVEPYTKPTPIKYGKGQAKIEAGQDTIYMTIDQLRQLSISLESMFPVKAVLK